VRTRDVAGAWGPWSAEVVAERGLAAADWRAALVGPGYAEGPREERRAPLLRHEFDVVGEVRHARLHVTAHGLAEVELNGARVGDHELVPGWTPYHDRLRTVTYDVTGLVRAGRNAVGAGLADGWFRGRFGFEGGTWDIYGTHVGLLAQLEVTTAEGTTVVATGGDWRSAPGPLTRASLYDGETFDARLLPAGWSGPGFDDGGWHPVAVHPLDPAVLAAPDGPPVRCTAELAPVTVTRTGPGCYLLDFGQNHSGRLRLRVPEAPAGTVVRARHAEVLQDGALYTRTLREAAATDELVSAGAALTWEPRFTVHGYRYAEITGWPGELRPGDVVSRVLHSDMDRTGWFTSSDPALDRLHENVVWSLRSNFVDIPTDCPQRDERLGWTGDIQAFAPTAASLYDVHGFLADWFRTLASEQRRFGGTAPVYAPWIPGGRFWRPDQDIAGWGDAASLTPLALHERSADRALLERQYAGATAWVDKVAALAGPTRLWDTGLQLGDWLDPLAPANAPARGRTDTDLVATAYAVRTLRIAGDLAERTGDAERAERYRMLAERSRAAFESSFVTPGGRMMNDTQTAYAIALRFALIADPDTRARAAARLAEVVRRDGFHIATGIVGTSMIAPALTESGSHAEAERLFFQPESPSWLFPVRVGATTIWERWDGLQEDGTLNPGGMISFNHVALGAVGQWLHEQVAGLTAAEPGYKRLRIRPYPLAGLDHASVRLETPYGEAVSGWRRDGAGTLIVHTRVPANTTAEIVLPDGAEHRVGSGDHEWRVELAAPAAPVPVTLDSSMADLADNPAAYAAFYRALDASPNRFVAGSVRRNALYREGLRIRDALVFVDASTLASIETALAEAIA
jgi:alpha-L-rhamnosidase